MCVYSHVAKTYFPEISENLSEKKTQFRDRKDLYTLRQPSGSFALGSEGRVPDRIGIELSDFLFLSMNCLISAKYLSFIFPCPINVTNIRLTD